MAGCTCRRLLPRSVDGDGSRPLPYAELRGRRRTVHRRCLRRGRAASHRRGCLRGVRPRGGGAAGAARRAAVAARTVPRPDPGLQGSGAAAGRPDVRRGAGAARRAGDDRRRDLGRYRLGGDRGLPRPRRARHLHALPAGPHLRGAAPADDDGRCAERACDRDRGHFRRLPGHREGAVRRRGAARATSTSRRSIRSTSRAIAAQIVYYFAAGAGARRAGAAGLVQRADRQFRQCLCRRTSPARMGLPIERLVIGTNANDILARYLDDRRDDDRAGRCRASARAWTSRWRAISSACCSS